MTSPLGELQTIETGDRAATIRRVTRETDVTVALTLDGTGVADVETGVGFYDHLLSSLAHHALLDLRVRAAGDLVVDDHHTVEDVALVLGAALSIALGDRAGIRRFGDAAVPMDESLATAVIDLGGRPVFGHRSALPCGADRQPLDPAGRSCPRGVRPDGRGNAPPPWQWPE